MQTFLPYTDFERSARVLDRARLGKQRVENLQILKALADPEYGWQNHPATKMWRGHFGYLVIYQTAITNEWRQRGYNDTCQGKTLDLYRGLWERHEAEGTLRDHCIEGLGLINGAPDWLGDERVHSSHRSNLLRKDPEWYSQFGWKESDDIPYYWPR